MSICRPSIITIGLIMSALSLQNKRFIHLMWSTEVIIWWYPHVSVWLYHRVIPSDGTVWWQGPNISWHSWTVSLIARYHPMLSIDDSIMYINLIVTLLYFLQKAVWSSHKVEICMYSYVFTLKIIILSECLLVWFELCIALYSTLLIKQCHPGVREDIHSMHCLK